MRKFRKTERPARTESQRGRPGTGKPNMSFVTHPRLWAILLAVTFTCGSLRNPSIAAPASRDVDWAGYGKDSNEQRFVPLRQIHDGNVRRLGLVWSLDLEGETALEGTPIEIGGILYFSGGFATVYAVDVRSGRLLWSYDPKATEASPREARRIHGNNRGVAYWNGKVFVATKDCRMIALNARTGALVWSSSFLVPGSNSTSSGAPRVFNGKVIIGNSGAEFGARGYVSAFDGETGKLLWRFFTVPGDPAKGFEDPAMAMAAKTWSGEWWKYGGGGTPWNAITFDEELGQIYIGTGNGGPWNSRFRSANGEDNLFLASVVALDANTGKYKWHYQYNPNEVWDYKATADIILTELTIAGKRHKVLMQAPTNGFFYVIDRGNGKLISAEKIGRVSWADRIDLTTGRPVERPGIRYEKAPYILYPDSTGAHNWQAMSYNPRTGLVYIPYVRLGAKFGPLPSIDQATDVTAPAPKIMLRTGVPVQPYHDPNDPLDGRGSLLAWDPVKQKLRWRVDYPTYLNAGTMTTAGNLVFQGTNQGKFYAYTADGGKRVWSFDAKLGIIAPPISYSVDGQQYISLLVGYGGTAGLGGPGDAQGRQQGWKYGLQPRRLLTFALDGKAKLPATPPPDFTVQFLDSPAIKLDPHKVDQGAVLFHQTCVTCHGIAAIPSGTAPDLRESAIAFDREAFATMLREAPALSRGMPLFDDLSAADVENIYQYIRSQAREGKKRREKQ